MGLNFRIPHTKGMWGKRKNECQGLQSFLHTLILLIFRFVDGGAHWVCNMSGIFTPSFFYFFLFLFRRGRKEGGWGYMDVLGIL